MLNMPCFYQTARFKLRIQLSQYMQQLSEIKSIKSIK